MIVLYSQAGQPLEKIKKDVIDSYKYLNHENEVAHTSRAKYLCEKLADYALPPRKFKIISKNCNSLDEVLNKQIRYQELTYDVLYDSLLHGAGAELIQLKADKKEVLAKRIDPEKLIIIRESDYEEPHTILFWEPLATNEAQSKEELGWWGDKKVWIDDKYTQLVIEGDKTVDTIEHGLGIHPINVLMPFRGKVFYEAQKEQIIKYEKTYDFLYKETKSTLNLILLPSSIKESDVKDFGSLRVIENVNMSQQMDGKPELLVKTPEYQGAFNFLEMANKRILQEAGIIDFTSQEQAGSDPSGEALKLRLIPMEDKCSSIYPELRDFLNNRHIVASKLLNFTYTKENSVITLETNMPEVFFPKVQAYLSLMNAGVVSLRTAQEQLGIDPETENEKIEKEEALSDITDAHLTTVNQVPSQQVTT